MEICFGWIVGLDNSQSRRKETKMNDPELQDEEQWLQEQDDLRADSKVAQ